LAGALIAFLAMFLPGGFGAVIALWICIPVGATVGAVTCWFGAATANYFHRSEPLA
jgi:predicted lipid-binding transport protein (Tim44 family)